MTTKTKMAKRQTMLEKESMARWLALRLAPTSARQLWVFRLVLGLATRWEGVLAPQRVLLWVQWVQLSVLLLVLLLESVLVHT